MGACSTKLKLPNDYEFEFNIMDSKKMINQIQLNDNINHFNKRDIERITKVNNKILLDSSNNPANDLTKPKLLRQ
jgi:hypothetical protein